MYWVASSSTSPDEKQEKWEIITNHIVNIHTHKKNKLFTECTNETVEREWLKKGLKILHVSSKSKTMYVPSKGGFPVLARSSSLTSN
jgi:hypothetical protein